MIGGMTVLARGAGPDATRWELNVSGDVDDLRTMVNVTLADGRRPWGSGCGGPALYPGKRINVCIGSSDHTPSTFLARVTADVRAVVVTMSDGAREDLMLHGDADQLGARGGEKQALAQRHSTPRRRRISNPGWCRRHRRFQPRGT